DGIQDTGEPGLPGVRVVLLAASGQVLGAAVTDATGHYAFPNVAAGVYRLQFLPLPGFAPSPSEQGSDESHDSDPDPTTGVTALFELVDGETASGFDAGFHVPPPAGATVGDHVWMDLNGNGIQDAGEPGVPGVVVHLLDGQGVLIAAATTDASGL